MSNSRVHSIVFIAILTLVILLTLGFVSYDEDTQAYPPPTPTNELFVSPVEQPVGPSFRGYLPIVFGG